VPLLLLLLLLLTQKRMSLLLLVETCPKPSFNPAPSVLKNARPIVDAGINKLGRCCCHRSSIRSCCCCCCPCHSS
jgi:hypothetical protein